MSGECIANRRWFSIFGVPEDSSCNKIQGWSVSEIPRKLDCNWNHTQDGCNFQVSNRVLRRQLRCSWTGRDRRGQRIFLSALKPQLPPRSADAGRMQRRRAHEVAVVNSSQELATSIMRLQSSPPIRILVMPRSRHCSSYIEISIDIQKQDG